MTKKNLKKLTADLHNRLTEIDFPVGPHSDSELRQEIDFVMGEFLNGKLLVVDRRIPGRTEIYAR